MFNKQNTIFYVLLVKQDSIFKRDKIIPPQKTLLDLDYSTIQAMLLGKKNGVNMKNINLIDYILNTRKTFNMDLDTNVALEESWGNTLISHMVLTNKYLLEGVQNDA